MPQHVSRTRPGRLSPPTAGGLCVALLAVAVVLSGCGALATATGDRGNVGIVPGIDLTDAVALAVDPPSYEGTHVPILMYHRIEEPPADGSNAVYYVSPKKFRRQMRALQSEGYTAVTLRQVWDYWHTGGFLPEKPVVLTFDDGTPGQVRNAAPVLREMGWPGCLMVLVNNINDSGHALALTPDMVRQLIADGWEIDSHSMTHPLLTTVSPATVRYEVAESRRRLRRGFGVPAEFFCYPGGSQNAEVAAAVKAAGYLGAVTVQPGAADPAMPFEMDRITVDGRHVLSTFLRDLRHYTANP